MSSTPKNLTITYALHPPPSVPSPRDLSPCATRSFPLSFPTESQSSPAAFNAKLYYESLVSSIAEARVKIGEDLTAWRDAVGTIEADAEKEALARRKEEDGEDDDEGEE
ncbi:hypothetical protein SERLA73DRAFT_189444 [Serpula lacrymans var. lacrymans S7.3]|uniref:EKC/KEOPS complex subunit GON7 n=2 Tax=Serpula lacrymans var. lacrymans TaxID=341189 RepID=F8QDN9_SERL3|nr:uncharacterized protein SERLADRAFT_480264 [Serpula lacrymans var. lacrymans S7.9]EGN93710.1 hypothetical protein SERLA73DRAFT_189444 [Serpula lacrymans var. lacrymans S7.3]EGO19080.1 hypothetical protein SERLADRAFT_480264 [Serpula lacrymans var. lacrymans S7.9]